MSGYLRTTKHKHSILLDILCYLTTVRGAASYGVKLRNEAKREWINQDGNNERKTTQVSIVRRANKNKKFFKQKIKPMNYFKQFSNRPAYGYKTCGGVTLTLQNQVESIQSMLNRATQGFPISRKNVIYGMDENIQPMIDDLTDYDSLRHEMEYYKKKAESQKELNSRKEVEENEEK